MSEGPRFGPLPPTPPPARAAERLPAGRALWRGLTLRCPRCGRFRPWSTGWFGRLPRCSQCAYRYERQEGFSLGAVTMNTAVTFGAIALVLLVGTILSYPDVAVVPIVAVAVVLAIAVPVAFYPVSYTLWASVDLLMRPLEPDEVADAAAHRFSPNGA